MAENKELLFDFETKYQFLYDFCVGGVPIYTCLRDGVLARLSNGAKSEENVFQQSKGKIVYRRIFDGLYKKNKFKNKKTLVFTSSIYRRDMGRNLAAEYLTDKFVDAIIFEWPSRNEVYDKSYLTDNNKDKYVPLDYFALKYKIYRLFHKKFYQKLKTECSKKLAECFHDISSLPCNVKSAVEYVLIAMPETYACTVVYQKLFGKYLKKYKNVEMVIDFWGGARENIIPALKNKPQSVELQHGIITAEHPGYIYPKFVEDKKLAFFKRKILVYGEKTKELLCKQSVFCEDKVEVVGNPRILKYKEICTKEETERTLILFASQPYEQDGIGSNYYQTVFQYLCGIKDYLEQKGKDNFCLAVKLHPREDNSVVELYKKEIPLVEIFDNTSQLYDLLSKTYLQLTVSSTTLYEAALFDCPTVTVEYNKLSPNNIFGFETWHITSKESIAELMDKIFEERQYEDYLQYLKEKTKNYM